MPKKGFMGKPGLGLRLLVEGRGVIMIPPVSDREGGGEGVLEVRVDVWGTCLPPSVHHSTHSFTHHAVVPQPGLIIEGFTNWVGERDFNTKHTHKSSTSHTTTKDTQSGSIVLVYILIATFEQQS